MLLDPEIKIHYSKTSPEGWISIGDRGYTAVIDGQRTHRYDPTTMTLRLNKRKFPEQIASSFHEQISRTSNKVMFVYLTPPFHCSFRIAIRFVSYLTDEEVFVERRKYLPISNNGSKLLNWLNKNVREKYDNDWAR